MAKWRRAGFKVEKSDGSTEGIVQLPSAREHIRCAGLKWRPTAKGRNAIQCNLAAEPHGLCKRCAADPMLHTRMVEIIDEYGYAKAEKLCGSPDFAAFAMAIRRSHELPLSALRPDGFVPTLHRPERRRQYTPPPPQLLRAVAPAMAPTKWAVADPLPRYEPPAPPQPTQDPVQPEPQPQPRLTEARWGATWNARWGSP